LEKYFLFMLIWYRSSLGDFDREGERQGWQVGSTHQW
jgi:hypothetical protein